MENTYISVPILKTPAVKPWSVDIRPIKLENKLVEYGFEQFKANMRRFTFNKKRQLN